MPEKGLVPGRLAYPPQMGDGRISMTRSGISLSLVFAALLLHAPAAYAAQLDKDSCTKLKGEQTQLEQGGTRGSLIRGPDWAKVNLPPEKLEQVRRLIEVDEQLLFRCGGRPLVLMPSDPDPAARETESKDGAKDPPAQAPPAKGAKTPEKKAPDTGKKSAVPLSKASAPVVDQPAKETAAPPATVPQPEAVPAAASPAPAAALAPASAKEMPPVSPVTTLPAATLPAPAVAPPAPAPVLSKEEQDKKAAAIKAAKAKAKKRADDAYSPLFGSWYNPFAQPAPLAKK
jgi:hypothetical protein